MNTPETILDEYRRTTFVADDGKDQSVRLVTAAERLFFKITDPAVNVLCVSIRGERFARLEVVGKRERMGIPRRGWRGWRGQRVTITSTDTEHVPGLNVSGYIVTGRVD